jgi:hypothetical protein
VDRFPLVSNLREALEAFFLAHPSVLKAAAARTAQAITETVDAVPASEMYRGRRQRPQVWQQRHEPRVAAYEAVCRLHDQGATVTEMARQLEISRLTVYGHLRRATPPELKTRTAWPSEKVLTPDMPYLIRRWRESGADSMQLWREIQAQRYRHSWRTVSRLITELRRASEAGAVYPRLNCGPTPVDKDRRLERCPLRW